LGYVEDFAIEERPKQSKSRMRAQRFYLRTSPYPAFGTWLMLQVVLFQPDIPQNTGNVARTCAATGVPLHLVEPLGFRITDRQLKRAGLDYWPHVQLNIHPDFASVRARFPQARLVYFSAHGTGSLYDFEFREDDCLVFGAETRGLPQDLLASYPGFVLRVPMDTSKVRSLNLATCVGIALFEALRQVHWDLNAR
jgi:tRNA (cytidine/uridine-2'-O-)-methyltransferase